MRISHKRNYRIYKRCDRCEVVQVLGIFCVFSHLLIGLTNMAAQANSQQHEADVDILPTNENTSAMENALQSTNIYSIKPVYILIRDISKDNVSDFDICCAAGKVVGNENIKGCQRYRGLYKIYVKDEQSRIKLLSSRISIGGQTVDTHNENPFNRPHTSFYNNQQTNRPKTETIRITIKDLPMNVNDDTIIKELQKMQVQVRSVIMARTRHPETKELTNWLNGDRLVYASKIEDPIPRKIAIGGFMTRIYHNGQNTFKSCTRCLSLEHTMTSCDKSDSYCYLCKTNGHLAGTEECTSVYQEPNEKTRTIYGYQDPLSNHFPCNVKVFGNTYQSAEHAYLHTKAIHCGASTNLVEDIKTASNAAIAKQLDRRIPFCDTCTGRKEKVMQEILQEKIKQVVESEKALIDSKNQELVGAAPGDFFWGSGLNSAKTALIHTDKWPGKNMLGKFLKDIRKNLMTIQRTSEEKETSYTNLQPPQRRGRSSVFQTTHYLRSQRNLSAEKKSNVGETLNNIRKGYD